MDSPLHFWLNGNDEQVPAHPRRCIRLLVPREIQGLSTSEKEIYLMSSTSRIADSIIAAEEFSTWNIDPAHSAAEFKVRHMMISNVKGKFSGLSGVLKLDETDYAHSTVEVSIPAASVRTVDEKLDAHLKAEDFFDVEKFPTLTFTSTNIHYTGRQEYEVAGDLTIRGVTKSVTLTVSEISEPAKDPWDNVRIGLSGSVRINRKDFGFIWNAPLEFGGVLVGDEVAITLDVQFIKA
jgi:polyisoprenoid-binding protein YceI